jgi:hypothetical protein
MTNLLDERIDHHQSMDWTYGHRVVRALFHGAPYQGIANTIVQLIRPSTSGVILHRGRFGWASDTVKNRLA